MYFGKKPSTSTQDSDTEEERALRQRHRLIYYLKVWDLEEDRLLGHLVDLNTDGFMLVSKAFIEVDRVYQLEIRWDEEEEEFTNIQLQAHSRWAAPDKNPALHGTGFQLVDPTEELTSALLEVIREYTFS